MNNPAFILNQSRKIAQMEKKKYNSEWYIEWFIVD